MSEFFSVCKLILMFGVLIKSIFYIVKLSLIRLFLIPLNKSSSIQLTICRSVQLSAQREAISLMALAHHSYAVMAMYITLSRGRVCAHIIVLPQSQLFKRAHGMILPYGYETFL